jgi:hypothetical protein
MLEGAGFALKSELVQMVRLMRTDGIGEELFDAESISGI